MEMILWKWYETANAFLIQLRFSFLILFHKVLVIVSICCRQVQVQLIMLYKCAINKPNSIHSAHPVPRWA